MDYDSYEVYERNSPVDCQEEAEIARERSRRMERERRAREDELQWEQDRNRDRNYGSKSFEDMYFAEGRGYKENTSGKYEDASFDGGDDYWEPSTTGKTFDYNHGMSVSSQAANKQKADFARREISRRLEDNLNAGVNRDPRPGIACDIKDEPSTSIFLGGIPRTLDERDLENELIRCGLHARDIRIIRSKETGANRGFAFVDFHSVPDAQRWMELNQGRLFLRNRFTISMDYSRTGSIGGSNGARGGKPEVVFKDDWKCSKCGCDNFQRRLQCFRCGLLKAESEKVKVRESPERRSRSGSNSPSCTLVIRGLDGLTEESGVVNALENVCRNCRTRNVFIVRNETTGIGEGYGYLEFYSRQEAEDIMERIRSLDCQLEIDGKEVLVDYSRESFATVVASLSESSLNSNLNQGYDYDRTSNHQYNSYYGETSVQNAPSVQQRNVSSGSIPKSTQYAKQYLAGPAPVASIPPSTDTSTQGTSFVSGTTMALSDNEFSNYASPDLNRYVFDDLTGYYIDPVTGLYYDAGTQYFYQMETGRFLYWDPEKNCYFPASEQGGQETKTEETTTAKSSEQTTLSKQEEEKQEKVNAAKKIAKDMDKWVKAQNSQKESGFKKPLAPICLPPKAKPSGAADAGFNVIAKSKFTIELPKPKEEKKVLAAPVLPGLVAYGGDSDSDTEADEDDAEKAAARDAERAVEEKLIAWEKLTCLLCRRAFSSADILAKHQQLSDLHKANLEEYKKKLTGTVTRATAVAKTSGITKSTTAKR